VYFSGTGERGAHAWMGYLLGRGRGWNLNVGRYEQDSYAIGHALDPQTWKRISDHEITFAQERYRQTETYRISRYHSDFAREFHVAGRAAEALRTVRHAIDVEPRNRDAWELVLKMNDARKNRAGSENALRMAVEAFRHFPHVEATYLGRLTDSLLDRNEFEEAFGLVQHVSRRNRQERPDIS